MQILTPVAGPDEVEPLVASGADELYAGIFPDSWYERWGRGAWPNRRGPGPANLRTIEQVVTLQQAAHATPGGPREGLRPVPLYLAVNAPFYTDAQADHLVGVLAEAHQAAPVDAFIVTDPGFMALLRERVPDAAVFASTVTVALNAESVRFLAEDLECSRVILSRHLDLREIRAIREAVPDVDLEVFLLNDNCYFEEGFCSTTHTMPGFGVYCMTPWEVQVHRDADGSVITDVEERARWDFLLDEHREFIRHLGSRGHGAGPTKMPLGPCGLCAIPELMKLGIHSGKIVGREASLFRKLRSVQAVRYVRDSYGEARESGADPKSAATEAKRRAIELRGDPAGCAAGYSCYYRPARERDLVPLPTRPRGPRRPRRK